MQDQAALALPPPAGAVHWDADILFRNNVINELTRVNAAFLGMAAEYHAARPGMPAFGLPGHILARLPRPGSALPQALTLPFALFDLRFRDGRFWRMEAVACTVVNDTPAARVAEMRTLRFAGTALTLAWHLARSEPRIARVSLGIEPATREVLAGLPVGSLDALARRVSASVVARFGTRERFWSLVASALRSAPEAGWLQRVRLMGLQLQGAESARAQQLHRRGRRSTQA